MATPAYMSITGTKQGLITAGAFTEDSVGNTYQEGHEDQVMVQGFNHEVIIPRDPQSGPGPTKSPAPPAPTTGARRWQGELTGTPVVHLCGRFSVEPKMSATSRNRHRAKDFRRRLSKSNVACSSNGLERNCPPGTGNDPCVKET